MAVASVHETWKDSSSDQLSEKIVSRRSERRMTWTAATNSRPEERNLPLSKLGYGAGTPNLVEQVLLLLDGVDGGKMNLHLGHHFHSPQVSFRSVEKRYIDLAAPNREQLRVIILASDIKLCVSSHQHVWRNLQI